VDSKIKEELESADIILLLVSSDFIASNYCYDVEVKKSVKRHEVGNAVVIPIILRPCLWQSAPFSKLQASPINTEGLEPITKWQNIDDAWYHVVLDIKEAARRLRDLKPLKEKHAAALEPSVFKFNNYARYKGLIDGEHRWDWLVYMDESAEKLNMVNSVEYHCIPPSRSQIV